MNRIYAYIILILCLTFSATAAFSQNRGVQDYQQMREEIVQKQKSTRAEIQQLSKQIQKFEERFELADQKYVALYEKYQDLKQLIALQDQKISKLESEQAQIQEEIDITTQSLEEKRKELNQLIENYKKTLGYLYKHGRTSQLALIFSSSSINQMLVRAFYLEKFNDYRERQAEEIRETEQELEQTKAELEKAKSKNEEVLAEIKNEKEELAKKKQQQEQNVALLRENRDKIKESLKRAQEQYKNLENTLASYEEREKEIEEEIKEAQRREIRRRELERQRNLEEAKKIKDDVQRSREVAKYSEPIEEKEVMDNTSSERLEESFANYKGRLPWPVESRTISEHFGNHRHPVYGTVTPRLGIEIVTDEEASVQAVHDGHVIDITPIPGYGDAVIVKHGRFITAYANLSQILIRKNEIVEQGDIIGLSGDEDSPRGESLFFLIRENSKNLDPEQWLQTEAVSSKH